MFIDKQQGRNTALRPQEALTETTVIGQMQRKGNSKMVRSEHSGSRMVASIAINMVLLLSVAVGAFYAIAPVTA